MLVLKAVLWALWGVGVLHLVALEVSVVVATKWARRGQAGSEYLPMAVGVYAVGTTSVGCLSGLVLILLSDGGAILVVLIVGTAVQLIGPGLVATILLSRLWAAWQNRRQLLSREEAVRLIEAGIVRSFRRRFGVVKLSLHPRAVEQFQLRTRRARGEDYPAFVAAANERDARGPKLY
ncbi:hypothetical protein ACWEGE_01735 [Amycolatopsis sp. NPDC004747]